MTPKQRALELAKFYTLLAENDNWFTFTGLINEFAGPNMASDINDYQINPPKPVVKTNTIVKLPRHLL